MRYPAFYALNTVSKKDWVRFRWSLLSSQHFPLKKPAGRDVASKLATLRYRSLSYRIFFAGKIGGVIPDTGFEIGFGTLNLAAQ